MHEVASKHGAIGNHMLAIVHWFMLILFIGWTAFMIVILFKFRAKKNPKASYHGITSHFSTHTEIGVIIVEIVLLLGFAFPLWAKRVDVDSRPKGEDVVNIRAVGYQFGWYFHYAGKDNVLGLTDYKRYSSTNQIGLVKEDPNAADDFISINNLVVPKDRPVVIQVTSLDVIHGLAIVPMFIQQDAIPGQEIPMWFVPEKNGEWDIVCAQLCGAGHAAMAARIEVRNSESLKGEEGYDEWEDQQRPILPKDVKVTSASTK